MSAMRACVLLVALAGALIAAACVSRLRAQDDTRDERGRIPALPMLPPLPAEAWEPAQGPVRLVVRDVSFTTRLGARVRVPFTEVRAPGPPHGEHVRLESVRVVGLSVISPADSIDTPFDPFLRVPGPRVSIARVALEDAVLGARAHPSQYEGEWLWRQEDVDVVLERVRFGGDEPIGAVVARADFAGEVRGRPLRVERLTGGLTRTLSLLETDLRASLGTTALELSASLRRDGGYAVQLAADTLLFSEVRALARAAPEVGSAAGVVRIAGAGDGAHILIPAVRAYAGESRLVVRGGIRTGEDAGADALIIDIPRLRAADLESVAGAGIPGGGEWAGEVRADAAAGGGVRVSGTLDRQDASGRLALEAVYRGEGDPQVVAMVRASELRVAEGELRAQLEARGPRDSLSLAGAFELRSGWPGTNGSTRDTELAASLEGVVHGRGESRVEATLAMRGLVRGEAVTADASGRVDLTGERPVQVSFETGAVPASLLLPAAFDSVRGTVVGRGTIGGTVAEPLIEATALLSHVEPNAGDSASVIADGEVRVHGALQRPRADVDVVLRSSTGGDRLGWIGGGAVLARDGALDVRIVADSLPLDIVPDGGAVRDVRGFATGAFHATGTPDAPQWSGSVAVRDGGFVVVRSGTPIDSLTGELELERESARVRLDGTAGPGPVWLEGEVGFARAPRTLVLAFRADSALLVATDSAHVIASADVSVEGAVTRPQVSGTIALLEGWIHEDNFKRQPPLDPASLPYESLRRRVPWYEERPEEPPLAVEAPPEEEPQVPPPADPEELTAGEERGPTFTGGVRIEIMPGVSIIDEDSEMYGRGTIDVTADSSGVRADGIYRIHDGFYANFGELFRVVGGAFVFEGGGMEPRMTLRAEHDTDAPLVSGIGGGLHAFDWQPPLELFAIGTPSVVSEELRRTALLPESQTELASYLLTQTEAQSLVGWRAKPFWPSKNGGEVAGARAGAQSLPLLWAYIANEGYDYLPLRVGYLRAGTVSVGGEYPALIPVSSLLHATARTGRWEARLSQPTAGWPAPGLRVRYGTGGLSMFAFDEPRYRPVAVPGGGMRPWDLRRRSGIGLRWRRDFD